MADPSGAPPPYPADPGKGGEAYGAPPPVAYPPAGGQPPQGGAYPPAGGPPPQGGAYPQAGGPPPQGYAPPPGGYPQGQPQYGPGGYPQGQPQYGPGGYPQGQPQYGPAQPGYGAPVIVNQPVLATTIVQNFRESPVQTTCPHCQAQIVTATRYEVGTFAWLICVILCVVGCDLGCCFIPFCIDGCKDVVHTCPNCQQQVSRWSRM